MTNATQVSLYGTAGDTFTKANTDDSWGTAVNPDGLNLGDVLKNETISGYSGSYTDALGCFRIRNTVTNDVKYIGLLSVITEEEYVPLDYSVSIEENDILEVFTVAVPT